MTAYTENCTQRIDGGLVNTLNNIGRQIQRWAKIQQLKINVRRERRQLLEMSDTMLNDLGITRSQALKESSRLDLPESRLNRLVSQVS